MIRNIFKKIRKVSSACLKLKHFRSLQNNQLLNQAWNTLKYETNLNINYKLGINISQSKLDNKLKNTLFNWFK